HRFPISTITVGHSRKTNSITRANMIHSLFVINHSGDVFMEKHWRSIIPRTVMDYFFEAQRQVVKDNKGHEDVPCVIATPHHYLISIYHNSLYFVAVCMSEVPPLFVIEFLHTVVDILEKYFSECNETNIKEHYVVVYELLDEVLDNGYPLATEPNILQELIKPPNIIGNLINTVTGKSNVSSTVFAEIAGKIECCVRLSGTPDLTLSFINPRLMDDVSLHPCVRLKRWENERILSFVPPDGSFCLMTYHVGCQSAVAIPIYIRHNFFL
ncbi:AP-3 complex subunit mu-1, partial [Daphnia magna]